MMVYGSLVGNIFTGKVSVGAAPVKAMGNPQSPVSGRFTLEIYNTDNANVVYLGNKDVTVHTGLPILAGERKIIPVNRYAADNLYLVAAATVDVIIAEYTP